MKKIPVILCAFSAASLLAISITCKPPKPLVTQAGGMIKGAVYSQISATDNPEQVRQVLLPDVLVSVSDSAGSLVDTVRTDLDGSYVTRILKKGKYQVCFDKNGFDTSCYPVEVSYLSNHPGPLLLNLKSRDYLYGTVKLVDGRPGIYRNYVFNVEFFTTVKAESGGNTQQARANVTGEYLISGVQRGSSYQVTATCQKAVVSQNIVNNSGVLDLTLPNSSPMIRGVTAFNTSNQPVLRTSPGQMLTVRAAVEDPDGQALSYAWVPMTNSPGSTFNSTSQVSWQLPPGAGRYQLFLLVMDNFGGTAYLPYGIEAGDERVKFSGVVRETVGTSPIANATIKINGQAVAQTDAAGYFKTTVPQGSQNRYVLNIEKAGYMLNSSIHFNEATGKDYILVRSTLLEFDPGKEIFLVEKEDEYTKFTKPNQDFSRPPARVRIPANAIVDSAGNPVTSNVFVAIRNIDLFDPRGLMPGDYGAVQGGQQKRLDSYGAVDIQIRDKADPNKRYNLASTALAEVSVPIPSPLAGSAPATTDFWDYNETSGVWEQIGVLTKSGNYYVGKTNKFSSLNADVAFSDATCIQLLDNPNRPAPFPVDVKITVPNGASPKILIQNGLTAANLTPNGFIIVRLPANLASPGGVVIEVSKNNVVLQSQDVPTRNPIPGPANLTPDPPYDYCSPVYLLLPQIPANPGSVFLKRVESTSADATNYYAAIGAPADLTAWKNQAGFSTGDDFKATYFNAGDLGFWRGMHQKNSSGGKVAYYVSNFTTDDDSNADMVAANSNAIATVAMEYSPLPGFSTPVTKFFVFDGNGQLATFADLDGYGIRYVPGLCIECHGGELPQASDLVSSATLQSFYSNPDAIPKFLPFDLKSFTYSNDPSWSRSNQACQLGNLNERILSTNNNNEIRDFLLASYTVTSTPLGCNFDDNAFVPGWNGTTPVNGVVPRNFYVEVVGPSCRGCHITRANPILRFGAESDFNLFSGSIQFFVCQTNRRMPNAKVTFTNFWTSTAPNRPDELFKFLNLGAGSCCRSTNQQPPGLNTCN